MGSMTMGTAAALRRQGDERLAATWGESWAESWADISQDPSIRLALATAVAVLATLAVVHACCLFTPVESWHGLTALCSAVL
ncbi:hypothetical protein GWI72_09835 [Microvirga tunisiensis]|uniref:Uncharacterized protein n=1 Tax=Pannonibacter tanglangensis TaxID=2750084 RepID=A0A7X5J968_9HYPH|nr:hypothetical protein [Pannonibacter sp. XCT-53]NBN78567.1 hypothetical protein [Pannonibacter sp. XCT-53]